MLERVPIPSITQSTLSPGFKYLGGLNPAPTPAGVPVKIISPGYSVIPEDRSLMMYGISNIKLSVLPFCLSSLFT